MTDEPEPTPPAAAPSNGAKRASRPPVRSGLAERKNPVGVWLREVGSALRRILLKDPIATFLLLASLGLAIAFFSLLGAIKPSSRGRVVPISAVQSLAKHREISRALLLDHDDRVEITTTANAPAVLPDGTVAFLTGKGTKLGTETLRLKPAHAKVAESSCCGLPTRHPGPRRSNSRKNSAKAARWWPSTSSPARARRRSSSSS